jgi:hypothetical protein
LPATFGFCDRGVRERIDCGFGIADFYYDLDLIAYAPIKNQKSEIPWLQHSEINSD